MAPTAKKPRLLVIEDNADTRGIYKDVFERENFTVLLADDGEKGLSYAQSTLPDVILLDLMLPKISGLEILKRLRSHNDTQHIPVMIFSARDASNELGKLDISGVTEYSAKALNTPKQMVSRVKALMARATEAETPSVTLHALQVAIKETAGDVAQLVSLLHVAPGFNCPGCQNQVFMELLPDATRSGGHWFVCHFLCPACHRTF